MLAFGVSDRPTSFMLTGVLSDASAVLADATLACANVLAVVKKVTPRAMLTCCWSVGEGRGQGSQNE